MILVARPLISIKVMIEARDVALTIKMISLP